MMSRLISLFTSKLPAWLAIGLCLSVAVLAWFGYEGIREWQRSAGLLADRRANEAADLLLTAITRDMRGAQDAVLTSAQSYESRGDSGYEVTLRQVAAGAFARYPYLEVLFAWRGVPTAASVVFFTRSERRPSWMPPNEKPITFPVLAGYEPSVGDRLVERIARDAAQGPRFLIFDITLGTATYQVVAHLLYDNQYRERPGIVFGFMVNLDWLRLRRRAELARAIAVDESSTPRAGEVVPSLDRFDPANDRLSIEQRTITLRTQEVRGRRLGAGCHLG